MTALFLLCWSLPASGSERLVRTWTDADGLSYGHHHAIAQDATGFLWLGTTAGLVRFDGRRFVRWQPSRLRRPIRLLAADGDALWAGVQKPGPLLDLTDRAHPVEVEGPDGPLRRLRGLSAADGDLYVIEGAELYRRRDGAWTRLLEDRERVVKVRAELDLAVTTDGVWALDPPRQLLARADLADAYLHDGELFVVDRAGRVSRDDEVLAVAGPWVSGFVERDGALWLIGQTALYALPSGEPVPHRPEIGNASAALADHEQSLWILGQRGIEHLPEPETKVFTAADGFLGNPQEIGLHDDTVWTTTMGLGIHRVDTEGVQEVDPRLQKGPTPCFYAGEWWALGGAPSEDLLAPHTTLLAGLGREDARRWTLDGDLGECSVDGDQLWVSTWTHLYRVGPDGPEAEWPAPAENSGEVPVKLRVQAGRVWWLVGDELCVGVPGTSACEALPGEVGHALTVHTWPDGETWVVTTEGGVLRGGPGDWQRLELHGHDETVLMGATPSPRGGVWVFGNGLLERLGQDGRILESPGPAQGVGTGSVYSLAEQEDGVLWAATSNGLVRVAPTARTRVPGPPPVVLLETRVDGQPLPPGPIALPYRKNRLEIELAALSYADPHALRYQISLRPDEADLSRDPTLRFVDVPPGRYTAEITASLDGRHWSVEPLRVPFRVQRPPWLQGWAIALYLLLVGTVATVLYQVRVRYLLGLERQRARIALDLHDEIGSGLGSIGLLAGVLGKNPAASGLAAEIEETAVELGTALTDIVWALRPSSDDPRALLDHLEARGRRLFPGTTRLEVRRPERWPGRLSLPVRRSLLRIALEALHNAAKYAQAEEVELGLAASGRAWTLWVADDGRGIEAGGSRPGGGEGLPGMRRRAEQIGAELTVRSDSGGTRVEVRFHPSARDRRVG